MRVTVTGLMPAGHLLGRCDATLQSLATDVLELDSRVADFESPPEQTIEIGQYARAL